MIPNEFKSAEQLYLSEKQKEALVRTLELLENGKLLHVRDFCPEIDKKGEKFTGHFNMAYWRAKDSCRTVACIGGTAELISGVKFLDPNKFIGGHFPPKLNELFFRPTGHFNSKTPAQAAKALRNYLTTGDAQWSTVL